MFRCQPLRILLTLLIVIGAAAEHPLNKRRAQILSSMQKVMGPLPKSAPSPPEVTILEEVSFPQFIRRKIEFASGDGDRVPAYLFLPRPAKLHGPAMLCLHQTTAIGKGEPAGIGGKPNLHYALELAERGYVVLAPDYPRFGDYQIDAYSMGYASATMKGIRNHRRAVDLLVSLPEVDPHRIGVIGHSLGGHNSLFLAAFEPRIAAVVTSCGFTSFRKYYGGNLTGWSHAGYMPRIASFYGKSPERMPFDFSDVLVAIAPRPVFINAPLHDSNFEWSGVDDCVQAAQPVYARIFHAPDGLQVLHPDTAHDFPPDIRNKAYEFLERSLGPGPVKIDGKPLRIATFKVDVTPPLGSPLCCAAGVKPAEKIVDPLSARGFILLGPPKPIVLAALDWEGIANEGWDEWRKAIASAAGTDMDHVSVHTLHQHDAPGYDPSAERILQSRGLSAKIYHPAFMREAIERVAAAVRAAARKPQTVTHLGLGRAKVLQVASNRRVLGPDGKVKYVRYSACKIPEARDAPEGVIDPYVRSVSFWQSDRALVSITYYATHPQSYYGEGGVSADFVGAARALRETELPGVAHIHFNGAGGNVAAGKYNDGSPEMRPILARRLADGMKAAWAATVKTPIRASDIGWSILPVSLPPAEAIRDQQRLVGLIEDEQKLTRLRLTAGQDLAFARLRAANRIIPLFLLTLGPARVIHMPGELFVEYQLAGQDMAPGQFMAMAAYGDYGPGYIGTRIAYSQGGYETGPVSRTSPDVEDVLLSAMRKLLITPER